MNKSESQEQIEKDSRVLAHITAKLKDGSIADSTKTSGNPSWMVLGEGHFSDAFEDNLIGNTEGDNLQFELEAVDAFGISNPDQIHFMEISQFPQDIELKLGTIVSFSQPDGGRVPGIIRSIEGASVKVDFNHPLAGQDVVFEIEIKQIAPKQ